jgi:hypothetical protein
MASTPNSGNYIPTLPRDQQRLADAASQGINAGEKIELGALGASGALSLASKVSDAANTLKNLPIAQGTKLGTSVTNIAKASAKPLMNVGRGASLLSPVGLYTAADIGTSLYRDDGKGLSELIGGGIGGAIGNMLYGDTSLPAITPQERAAMAAGSNPNKPTGRERYPSYGKDANTVGYEPMQPKPPVMDMLEDEPTRIFNSPVAQSSTPSRISTEISNPSGNLNQAATQDSTPVRDPVRAPTAESPMGAPVLSANSLGYGYAGAANDQYKSGDFDTISKGVFDTPMTGERPIDPQTGEPLSQRTIEAAARAGLELQTASVPQAPQEPQAPQSPRDIAVAKNEARLQAIRSGGGLSEAAQIVQGQMKAPEGFYNPAPATDQFSPQAPQAPEVTVGDRAISNFLDFKEKGGVMDQDKVDKATEYAASMGRAFDPETGYSKDFDPVLQDAYKERMKNGGFDSNLETTSDKTKTPEIDPTKPAAPNTPEEAKTQDQIDYETEVQKDEQGIIDKARERGDSQEDIDSMLEGVRERRADAESERSLESMKTLLEIKKMSLENADLERKLGATGSGEEVDIPKVKAIYGMMEDQGVSQDPNTGAMTFTTDSFWNKDKKNALAPNSSLFQQLARTPEGRYILNTRPPEINSVEDPDPELLYEAEDGRYFNYSEETEDWSVMVNF